MPSLLAYDNGSDSKSNNEDEDGEETMAPPHTGVEYVRDGKKEETPEKDDRPAAVQASGVMAEEVVNLPDYILTDADRCLDEVSGDLINDNNRSHLDGEIADTTLL